MNSLIIFIGATALAIYFSALTAYAQVAYNWKLRNAFFSFIMVSLLKGDIYKTEYGSAYMGLTLTVMPLIVVYMLLSKYIIAGVALGGVKG